MRETMPFRATLRVRRTNEKGFTLLEMMFACLILTVCAVGVLTVFSYAVARNAGQDQATRSTEFAQDKMEQLMAISFDNTTNDVTVYPTQAIGGTCANGLTAGGGVTPSTVVTCFVDYIDKDGNLQTTATAGSYKRQWKVADDGNTPTQIKTITVLVTPPPGMLAPSTMLISQKQSY